MDTYGQIITDVVLFNGGSVDNAFLTLNKDKIKDVKVTITTTDDREITFDSKKSEINNIEVSWDVGHGDN